MTDLNSISYPCLILPLWWDLRIRFQIPVVIYRLKHFPYYTPVLHHPSFFRIPDEKHLIADSEATCSTYTNFASIFLKPIPTGIPFPSVPVLIPELMSND